MGATKSAPMCADDIDHIGPSDRLFVPVAATNPTGTLQKRFDRVRGLTLALVSSLSDADASVQSMPDASPAKWHLAHTTWFFETFVLRDFFPDYEPFDARFPFLFNSYYEAEGARIARISLGNAQPAVA